MTEIKEFYFKPESNVFKIQRQRRKDKQGVVIHYRTLEDQLYVSQGACFIFDEENIRKIKYMREKKLNEEYEYCVHFLHDKLVKQGKLRE